MRRGDSDPSWTPPTRRWRREAADTSSATLPVRPRRRRCLEDHPLRGRVESRIIGKGGQNIRALRERSGAQIKVRNETRDAEITGHPQAVEAAAAAIEEIIHNSNTTGSAGPGPGGGRGGGGGGYGGGYAQPGGYQQGGYGGGYQQQGGYGGGYQQQGGYGGGYGQGYAQGGYDQGAQYGGYQQQGAAYGGGGGGGPAPTGATGLPPGWQELSANGQVYYWNTETNVTQYERPQ